MVRAGLAAVLVLCSGLAAAATPARVVSVNACTDQLAMLLAAPGQLVSVSRFAADPTASAMAGEAAAIAANGGLAEEVFGLAPDLVLAGTFTTRTTVTLLRRLGVPVLELPPAASLDAIPGQMRLLGAALGREAAAAALAAAFEADLARLRAEAARRPRASVALHEPNGFTSAADTLADSIVAAAGFDNVAARQGARGFVHVPLETLVLADPDLTVTSRRYAAPSRAEERLAHPALAQAGRGAMAVTDARWICGGPFTLEAVRDLAALHDSLALPRSAAR